MAEFYEWVVRTVGVLGWLLVALATHYQLEQRLADRSWQVTGYDGGSYRG